jgi:hypothetical protein
MKREDLVAVRVWFIANQTTLITMLLAHDSLAIEIHFLSSWRV